MSDTKTTTEKNPQPKTQLAHVLFSEEELNQAVALYRERSREDDGPELKQMLKTTAFRQCCKLEGETRDRALAILQDILLQDMDVLFEPETSTETPTETPEVASEAATDYDHTPTGDSMIKELSKSAHRILDIYDELDADETLTPKEIKASLGMANTSATRALNELMDAGLIEKVKKGIYRRTVKERLADMSTEASV